MASGMRKINGKCLQMGRHLQVFVCLDDDDPLEFPSEMAIEPNTYMKSHGLH